MASLETQRAEGNPQSSVYKSEGVCVEETRIGPGLTALIFKIQTIEPCFFFGKLMVGGLFACPLPLYLSCVNHIPRFSRRKLLTISFLGAAVGSIGALLLTNKAKYDEGNTDSQIDKMLRHDYNNETFKLDVATFDRGVGERIWDVRGRKIFQLKRLISRDNLWC